MAQRRSSKGYGKQGAELRKDVREAIERVWPDRVMDMTFDSEESYFRSLYRRLRRSLQRIEGARLLHEIEADGGPVWFEGSDSDEDPPDDITSSRSYHLFFVSPEGNAFTYETETEEIDEEALAETYEETGAIEEPMMTVPGLGHTGWSVAVSLLAPFAVLTFGDMEVFENGSTSEPQIESYAENFNGGCIDPEENFRKFAGEQAFEVLRELRGAITGILERYGISVLPKEEWSKPVKWLKAEQEILVDKPICVLDAFFFEEL